MLWHEFYAIRKSMENKYTKDLRVIMASLNMLYNSYVHNKHLFSPEQFIDLEDRFTRLSEKRNILLNKGKDVIDESQAT